MSVSFNLEAVLLLSEVVLRLVEVDEEEGGKKARSEVDPHDHHHDSAASQAGDKSLLERVREGQIEEEEEDDLEDEDPEEDKVNGVDHDMLIYYSKYKQIQTDNLYQSTNEGTHINIMAVFR